MFKKLSLILLLCSAILNASESSKNFTSSPKVYSVSQEIGLGVAAFLIFEVFPKILESYSTPEEETQNKTVMYLKCLNTTLAIALGLYYATKLGIAAKSAYAYFYPNDEQKAKMLAAAQSVKIYKAEDALMACLFKNTKTPRNDSGCPIVCDELAKALLAVADQAALNEIITNFKLAYPV